MRIWCLALIAGGCLVSVASAEPLIYAGYAVTFQKGAFADGSLPANQDFIVHGVRITRGTTRGIFNIAREGLFQDSVSPVGTAWAFPRNNPEATISADNYAALLFEDWQTANGGAGGGPPATVGENAVLHLIDQDIYLDVRFTSWGIGAGAGGAFSYERAAIAPSADFDRDGDVDGGDFLAWQRSLGAVDALQLEGDADFDGVVGGEDLQVWETSFSLGEGAGDLARQRQAGASGAVLGSATNVPEPSGGWLMALASPWVCRGRRGVKPGVHCEAGSCDRALAPGH
jgi:hypothetical protein